MGLSLGITSSIDECLEIYIYSQGIPKRCEVDFLLSDGANVHSDAYNILYEHEDMQILNSESHSLLFILEKKSNLLIKNIKEREIEIFDQEHKSSNFPAMALTSHTSRTATNYLISL